MLDKIYSDCSKCGNDDDDLKSSISEREGFAIMCLNCRKKTKPCNTLFDARMEWNSEQRIKTCETCHQLEFQCSCVKDLMDRNVIDAKFADDDERRADAEKLIQQRTMKPPFER